MTIRLRSSAKFQILSTVAVVAALAAILILETALAAPGNEKQNGDRQQADESKEEKSEEAANRKAQMAAMRRAATNLAVKVDQGPRNLDMIPEPLFRSQDPARDEFDGTIWGYGKTGRPAALLTLALQPVGGGSNQMMYELNSLTSRSVTARIPGFPFPWSSRKPGLEMKEIPDAPASADKEAGRTRQFRDLSARYSAYEMLQKSPNGPMERFELRLIPRPIHRYSDPASGLIDGAIFLMTHSTNPEVIMVIELVRNGETATWRSGFARCAWAEIHVELDGKETWTQPHLNGTSAADPYWLFVRPVPQGDLAPE